MFVQIKDFPDYMVDENGTVVSLKKGKWKVLKGGIDNHGYPRVDLFKNGNRTPRNVHSIVAEVFLGPKPEGMEVNHINGCKSDCYLGNLEYCSHKENTIHAWVTGLHTTTREAVGRASSLNKTGEKHHNARLSDSQAAELLALRGTMTQREAGSLFGVGRVHVSNIWNGKKRKHLQGIT